MDFLVKSKSKDQEDESEYLSNKCLVKVIQSECHISEVQCSCQDDQYENQNGTYNLEQSATVCGELESVHYEVVGVEEGMNEHLDVWNSEVKSAMTV